ncbi:MAG TPA: JAB domain-containing protein [Longimicrobium sp.]|jgi:DNA repair protein RadC
MEAQPAPAPPPAAAPDATGEWTGVPVYRCRLEVTGTRAGMPQVGTPADAVALARALIPTDADRIHVVGIALDVRNRAIGAFEVGVGSLDTALLCPPDCLKPALLLNAAAVILAMNHVSGEALPPSHDTLVAAGRVLVASHMLGIPLLDLVILGDGSYASLRDRGDLSGWLPR